MVALFDMGESVSNLTILVDKLPRFTRDIFIGGRDFTKMISNVLGVSFEEAQRLKQDPADKAEQVPGGLRILPDEHDPGTKTFLRLFYDGAKL